MKALVVIFTSMLILSACSDEPKSIHYLCNDRVVELAHQGAGATLTLNGQTYALNKEPSASGVKYINERVLFWSKADEAMLIVSGNKYHCQLQQADAL